ncbi:MAG: DUF5723 family protein [Candidatus Marinimicrobia bacterium]|nr:DUF5723 family protein [Candidatus Neomarinimicrobiota bacterium]
MRKLVPILIIMLVLVDLGFGQAHIDARGLGLCNVYTVSSRGVSAIGYNPANLGYTEDLTFSADLFDFNISGQNNFLSLALFNQYFAGDRNGDPIDLEKKMPGRDITHKEFLLSKLSEDGFTFGMGVSVPIPLLNISVGNYAFTSGVEYFMQNSLPLGLFEFLLEGNQIGNSLDLATKQDVLMVTNFGFSFAIPFEKYNVGATIKYLAGIGFAGVDSSGGAFSTHKTGLQSDAFYRYTRAIGGNGLAIDLGFNTRKINNWQFGVAINNVIGFINWGKDDNFIAKNIGIIEALVPVRDLLSISTDSSTFSASTLYSMDMDKINVVGALANSDSLFKFDEQEVPRPDSMRMNYPAVFRIGGSYQYKNDFVVMADLSAGLDDYYFADRSWRLALAAEWIRFGMVPIRSGMAFGGRYGSEASIGAGVHLIWFDADLALKLLGGMSFANAEGVELGISFQFKR